MPNINLKYLIIGVISLSILIVAGAFIFSLIKSNKSPSNQKPNQTIVNQPNKENKQVIGPGGGTIPSQGGKPLSIPFPRLSK